MDAAKIKEHMEVVGSDGEHVGTVDKIEGDRLKLTCQDPDALGEHHYLRLEAITTVSNVVTLTMTAAECQAAVARRVSATAATKFSVFKLRSRNLKPMKNLTFSCAALLLLAGALVIPARAQAPTPAPPMMAPPMMAPPMPMTSPGAAPIISPNAPLEAPAPMPMMGPPPPPASPEMQRVLDQLMLYDAPPIPTLTPQNARETPSAQFAAQEVLSKDGKPSIPPIGDVFHRLVPGQNGKQTLVRFYRPAGATGTEPLPMVVYFHGGGFVISSINGYDGSARTIANGANCIVASVAYPLAPENLFPAAPETCYAATQYLMRNAAAVGADPNRVAVAGESAGGNLATVVCMMAKDRGGLMPVHQLLVYPYVLNSDRLPDDVLNQRFSSYATNANAMPLGKPLGKWFWRYYLPRGAAQPAKTAQYAEPIVALTSEVRGLPPATIVAAEIDALVSEGQQYRDKLVAAGVPVSYQLFPGITHEAFGMGVLVPGAKAAEDFATGALRTAFTR